MRTYLALLAAALLAAALPATAQDDACVQAEPCPWDVVVDASGIVESSLAAFTVGDWYNLTVSNDDLDAEHTVTLSRYGVSLSVPPLSDRTMMIHFTQTGTFELSEAPKGTTLSIQVVEADSVDFDNGVVDENGNPRTAATSGGSGTPGVEIGVLACAVLAVAILARRTK